jgi:hypothetical protein
VCQPPAVSFDGFIAGKPLTQSVRVVNTSSRKQRVRVALALGYDSAHFRVESESRGELAPGAGQVFRVIYANPLPHTGDGSGEETTRRAAAAQPRRAIVRVIGEDEELECPVTAIPAPVSALPTAYLPHVVDLGDVPLLSTAQRRIDLSNPTSGALRIRVDVSQLHPDMALEQGESITEHSAVSSSASASSAALGGSGVHGESAAEDTALGVDPLGQSRADTGGIDSILSLQATGQADAEGDAEAAALLDRETRRRVRHPRTLLLTAPPGGAASFYVCYTPSTLSTASMVVRVTTLAESMIAPMLRGSDDPMDQGSLANDVSMTSIHDLDPATASAAHRGNLAPLREETDDFDGLNATGGPSVWFRKPFRHFMRVVGSCSPGLVRSTVEAYGRQLAAEAEAEADRFVAAVGSPGAAARAAAVAAGDGLNDRMGQASWLRRDPGLMLVEERRQAYKQAKAAELLRSLQTQAEWRNEAAYAAEGGGAEAVVAKAMLASTAAVATVMANAPPVPDVNAGFAMGPDGVRIPPAMHAQSHTNFILTQTKKGALKPRDVPIAVARARLARREAQEGEVRLKAISERMMREGVGNEMAAAVYRAQGGEDGSASEAEGDATSGDEGGRQRSPRMRSAKSPVRALMRGHSGESEPIDVPLTAGADVPLEAARFVPLQPTAVPGGTLAYLLSCELQSSWLFPLLHRFPRPDEPDAKEGVAKALLPTELAGLIEQMKSTPDHVPLATGTGIDALCNELAAGRYASVAEIEKKLFLNADEGILSQTRHRNGLRNILALFPTVNRWREGAGGRFDMTARPSPFPLASATSASSQGIRALRLSVLSQLVETTRDEEKQRKLVLRTGAAYLGHARLTISARQAVRRTRQLLAETESLVRQRLSRLRRSTAMVPAPPPAQSIEHRLVGFDAKERVAAEGRNRKEAVDATVRATFLPGSTAAAGGEGGAEDGDTHARGKDTTSGGSSRPSASGQNHPLLTNPILAAAYGLIQGGPIGPAEFVPTVGPVPEPSMQQTQKAGKQAGADVFIGQYPSYDPARAGQDPSSIGWTAIEHTLHETVRRAVAVAVTRSRLEQRLQKLEAHINAAASAANQSDQHESDPTLASPVALAVAGLVDRQAKAASEQLGESWVGGEGAPAFCLGSDNARLKIAPVVFPTTDDPLQLLPGFQASGGHPGMQYDLADLDSEEVPEPTSDPLKTGDTAAAALSHLHWSERGPLDVKIPCWFSEAAPFDIAALDCFEQAYASEEPSRSKREGHAMSMGYRFPSASTSVPGVAGYAEIMGYTPMPLPSLSLSQPAMLNQPLREAFLPETAASGLFPFPQSTLAHTKPPTVLPAHSLLPIGDPLPPPLGAEVGITKPRTLPLPLGAIGRQGTLVTAGSLSTSGAASSGAGLLVESAASYTLEPAFAMSERKCIPMLDTSALPLLATPRGAPWLVPDMSVTALTAAANAVKASRAGGDKPVAPVAPAAAGPVAQGVPGNGGGTGLHVSAPAGRKGAAAATGKKNAVRADTSASLGLTPRTSGTGGGGSSYTSGLGSMGEDLSAGETSLGFFEAALALHPTDLATLGQAQGMTMGFASLRAGATYLPLSVNGPASMNLDINQTAEHLLAGAMSEPLLVFPSAAAIDAVEGTAVGHTRLPTDVILYDQRAFGSTAALRQVLESLGHVPQMKGKLFPMPMELLKGPQPEDALSDDSESDPDDRDTVNDFDKLSSRKITLESAMNAFLPSFGGKASSWVRKRKIPEISPREQSQLLFSSRHREGTSACGMGMEAPALIQHIAAGVEDAKRNFLIKSS